MLRISNQLTSILIFRTFTSSVQLQSVKKQGKILKKLVYGSEKNRRKWYESKDMPSPAIASIKGQGKQSNRRLSVLNTLFMEQITDLMASGEFSQEIVGLGIQISRVKVSSDYHFINIFWYVRDSGNDAEIEKILKRISGGLQHELAQLRLIGNVPRLNFVKDKEYGITASIDSVLRNADYGEDFVPKDRTLLLKNEVKLHLDLPPKVRQEISRLEEEPDFSANDQDSLPPMRQDVLGLDHFAIMSKIKRSINRNKLAWKQYALDTNSSLSTISEENQRIGVAVEQIDDMRQRNTREEVNPKLFDKFPL
ncbi:uncharacterized protein LOC131437623 [Malaya genurostris]|uniref:uncharacterized protein LOC131437623 n=1 Tax=Malaya genurostris TaxID=325434 RepID=UPI0026F384BD|nr:uncharacterized protein LOC131437623 [Malaya genurostris]